MLLILAHSSIFIFYDVCAKEPFDIRVSADSKSIELDKVLIVTVTITNKINSNIKDLSIVLSAPDFTIQQEPKWPGILHPKSQLKGFYILKSNLKGEPSIWATATYSLNMNTQNFTLENSTVSDPVKVNINDKPFFEMPFNNIWIGAITTAIGTLLGLLFPEIKAQITDWRQSKRDRRNSVSNIRVRLLAEINNNRGLINNSEACSTSQWDKIESEDGYSLLAEDQDRIKLLVDLYHRFKKYNSLNEVDKKNENKNEYFTLIDKTGISLNSWK